MELKSKKKPPLRRHDRALPEDIAKKLLKRAEYGVLSTVSADGAPYGVPLNFCVLDNRIYFHSAASGHKIDNLTKNQAVSFCVVGNTEVLAEKFSTRYESVVVFGQVNEVFEPERRRALEGLLHKYSAAFIEKGREYIKNSKESPRVFAITCKSITGKARR